MQNQNTTDKKPTPVLHLQYTDPNNSSLILYSISGPDHLGYIHIRSGEDKIKIAHPIAPWLSACILEVKSHIDRHNGR